MNVLVMSISQKVPMLKAVKESLRRVDIRARLYGADTNMECIGRYFIDRFWHCPQLVDLEIDEFIRYCLNENISLVFPSRDGELEYFAKYRDVLGEHGVHVMVSDTCAIKISGDKLEFSQRLGELGYPVIPSYTNINFSSDYYVVKERYGAGSNKVGIKLLRNQVQEYLNQLDTPIIQPFIDGTECSADVYVDKYNKTKGVVIRERNYVMSGESQITTSFRNESIEQLFGNIAEQLSMCGHVMFQFIKDYTGNIHIIECNARFGGASTLSLAMGLDSFYWFIQETRGVPSEQLYFDRSQTEKMLVRHAEDLIL